MKPETVSSEVPAFSVQAAACAEASEASWSEALRSKHHRLFPRPDEEATVPQRDNTYVLVCAELKLVSPQRMLKRRRLRPVMERAGNQEVASLFSIDLSNNLAQHCCANCFGKCTTKRPS